MAVAITESTVKKILKESGAVRVSNSAVSEFSRLINRYAYTLAKRAVRLAAHAKRKTVEKSDVELAK